MDLVRQGINDVRTSWDQYPVFMDELQRLMRIATVDTSLAQHNDRLKALLSSHKEWTTPHRQGEEEQYEAIRLYASKLGYQQIFSVINAAFRSDDLVSDRQRLRSAVFLIELLNIDLFNYRARHPHADGFHGTVYRGMCVSDEELSLFKRAVAGPVSERYLAIPLGMVSASMKRGPAVTFALRRAGQSRHKHPVIWEIHVENLAPELLSFYRERFPHSVVTSLCAVPIDQLSDYPEEKEVLLRGPFFQLVQVGVDESAGYRRPVHKIVAVTLNTNRDHLTAIASNEGTDRRMRDLFRAIIGAHRSNVCADLAEKSGQRDDAQRYRSLAAENLALVDSFGQ